MLKGSHGFTPSPPKARWAEMGRAYRGSTGAGRCRKLHDLPSFWLEGSGFDWFSYFLGVAERVKAVIKTVSFRSAFQG